MTKPMPLDLFTRLPPALAADCVDGLAAGGYPMHGELSDLVPGEPSVDVRRPDDVTARRDPADAAPVRRGGGVGLVTLIRRQAGQMLGSKIHRIDVRAARSVRVEIKERAV